MTFDTLSLSLVYKKRMLANVIKKRKAKTLYVNMLKSLFCLYTLQGVGEKFGVNILGAKIRNLLRRVTRIILLQHKDFLLPFDFAAELFLGGHVGKVLCGIHLLVCR